MKNKCFSWSRLNLKMRVIFSKTMYARLNERVLDETFGHFFISHRILNILINLRKSPALSSSSESFWSRSRTFSTFVFMMSTTSSTCACVACNRFCEAICWGVLGPPTMPSVPAPAPAAASGAKPPSEALKTVSRIDKVFNSLSVLVRYSMIRKIETI